MRKISSTSQTGISRWAPLTLWVVSEVSAIAQCPWWAGIGWRVRFGGTRGTCKPIKIQSKVVGQFKGRIRLQARHLFVREVLFVLQITQVYRIFEACFTLNLSLPLHAVHIGCSQSHLCAGFSCITLSAVSQLILTLWGVKGAWRTGHRVASPLKTVKTSRAFETVLHTWRA